VVNSQRIAHESTQVIKSPREGLGGIRDVLNLLPARRLKLVNSSAHRTHSQAPRHRYFADADDVAGRKALHDFAIDAMIEL